jgi:hypothetical protein
MDNKVHVDKLHKFNICFIVQKQSNLLKENLVLLPEKKLHCKLLMTTRGLKIRKLRWAEHVAQTCGRHETGTNFRCGNLFKILVCHFGGR